MNYGERQERALWLIKVLREHPDHDNQIVHRDHKGLGYTREDIAKEIERETLVGRTTVSVAGLVIFALTPKTPA